MADTRLPSLPKTSVQTPPKIRQINREHFAERTIHTPAMQRYGQSWDSVGQELMQARKPMQFSVLFFLLVFAFLLDIVDLLGVAGVTETITTPVSIVFGIPFYLIMIFAGQKENVQAASAAAKLGVKIGTKLVVKIVVFLGFYIIEDIPGLGILPFNIIAVCVAYIIAHPKFQEKFNEAIGKVEQLKQAYEKTRQITSKMQRVVSTLSK